MQESKEIQALLKLIDDPDDDVYETVSTKIISFGKDIIPNLEHFGETVDNTQLQEKIALLINELHFTDLKAEFEQWVANKPDLLAGAMLVAKFENSHIDTSLILKSIEKLRRNVWLEMNIYLTPIEQMNVLSSIVYSYYKQKGLEINYNETDGFLIDKTLYNHAGNSFGNGILLLILCNLLDVPVHAISIPQQFLLAYFDMQFELLNPSKHASEKIKFYLDPLNGQLYSHKDVELYFKKLSVPPVSTFFKPLSNVELIAALLQEISKCYSSDIHYHKKNQINILLQILLP